jgi:hypothetical protein
MTINLMDVSGVAPLAPTVTCYTCEEIEAWVAAHAHGAPRCYDLHRRGGGVRFALGESWCGWIFAVEGSAGQDMWTLEEGDGGGEDVEVWMDGETIPISSATGVTRARLIEVLSHYLSGGERPAGRWVDDHGRVERPASAAPYAGPAPAARGRHVRALVAALDAQPRRQEPDAEVLSLIALARDQDMAAYLYAFAHAAHGTTISIYDLWPTRPRQAGQLIILGCLASGEEISLERGAVSFMDEEGSIYSYRGLEEFLDEWCYKARERGEETSLDGFLEG